MMKNMGLMARQLAAIRLPEGARKVFTNGCFDIIHPGHVEVLKACRQISGIGGLVIVGLNSDDSVRRLKGEGRPVFPMLARSDVLWAIRYVDYVLVFDEDTPDRLIDELRPDVIVKGGDYEGKLVVGHDRAEVHIVPLVREYSTTSAIKKVRN